ncbi:MAG: hypothetical protein WBQ43_13655 [Terriglobales bacterium]
MIASKLPRRFALAGIVLGFALMALYWYDYKYNPFHFPTSEAADKLTSFPPHPVYHLAEKGMYVLCPGLFLQVLTIGTSDRLGWAMWVLAAFLNGPIYYLLGLLFMAITKGGSHPPASVK